MTGYNFRWYEDMPTPWDIDCRGKFCIHEMTFSEDEYRLKAADHKYQTFTRLRKEIESSGKFEFLKNQGIDYFQSAKYAVVRNHATYEVTLTVLVDMPHNLRTLYKLTFTE